MRWLNRVAAVSFASISLLYASATAFASSDQQGSRSLLENPVVIVESIPLQKANSEKQSTKNVVKRVDCAGPDANGITICQEKEIGNE